MPWCPAREHDNTSQTPTTELATCNYLGLFLWCLARERDVFPACCLARIISFLSWIIKLALLSLPPMPCQQRTTSQAPHRMCTTACLSSARTSGKVSWGGRVHWLSCESREALGLPSQTFCGMSSSRNQKFDKRSSEDSPATQTIGLTNRSRQ